MQARLILMLSVILGSLAVGYLSRKRRWLPEKLSANITRWTMTWVQPVLLALMIWGLEAPGWRTALLPLMLTALIAIAWPIGAFASRLMGLPNDQAGFVTLSFMFSNMGLTYGAFVCYILLGEQGAALGMIWCIAFMPMFYTLGFIVARRFGHDTPQPIGETIITTLREPESRNPLLGFAVGGLLYAVGPLRPEGAGDVVDLLVPLSTGIYLFAIGLSLRLTSVVTYWRECLAIGWMKFVLTPALGLAMAWLAGFFAMEDHTLLKVVFIQSSTPTAIMGLILAQLFDLDQHLANAAWITTNVAAVALAPLILKIAAGL